MDGNACCNSSSDEPVVIITEPDKSVAHYSLSSETIENFKSVKSTNWSKSHFISSEKFFKLSSCDKNHKLTFLCALCPSKPGVHINADPSSSGNLRVHISRRHKDALSEFDSMRKNRPKKRCSEVPVISSSESGSQLVKKSMIQTTIFSKTPKSNESANKQKEFEKALIELVVDAMLPLSIVENAKFIGLFSKVCPTLSVPSRTTLSRQIFNVTSTVKAQLKEILHAQDYLCTTADIRSNKHRSYMGVSVHWINAKTLQRESGVLGCYRFIGSHTFDRVGEMLDTIQRDFGIKERKVVATVTENASNFVKAFKEFGIRDAEVSHSN